MIRYPIQLTLCCLAALVVAGCAGGVRTSATPEELTAERAAKRWEAAIAGDWKKAYRYLTPGYRKVVDIEAYEANALARNVQWRSAEVREVRCEQDVPGRCVAFVSVRYEVIGGVRGVPNLSSNHILRENWLLEDGNWYHLPRRAGR
jgi:hypothetical protein